LVKNGSNKNGSKSHFFCSEHKLNTIWTWCQSDCEKCRGPEITINHYDIK